RLRILRSTERERKGHFSNAGGCAASGLVRGVRYPVLAVNRNGVERVKRFPRDALRIQRPVLVALSVAAGSAFLRQQRDVGLRQARSDFFQFHTVLGLDTQVVQAGL